MSSTLHLFMCLCFVHGFPMLSGWKRYLAISWCRAIKDKPRCLTSASSIVFDIVRHYLCIVERNIVRCIVRAHRAIYRLDMSCDTSCGILWHPPNARALMAQFGWFDPSVCLIFSHDVLVASRNDIVAKCIEHLTTIKDKPNNLTSVPQPTWQCLPKGGTSRRPLFM